jgi:hypothetical protein
MMCGNGYDYEDVDRAYTTGMDEGGEQGYNIGYKEGYRDGERNGILREPKYRWNPVKPHTNDYPKQEDGILPLNVEDVLVVRGKQITIGLYDKSCWYYLNQDKMKYEMDTNNQVTHWMPMPKLPE